MRKRKKDDIDKKAEYMAQFRHKCKYCGHTIYMSEKHSKKILVGVVK